MDDAHDAALEVGGQLHQLFHQSRGLLTAVDVERQVADVVEDDEVRAIGLDGQRHHLTALLVGGRADVEHIEPLIWERCLYQFGDPAGQDVLRRLQALLGVEPEHAQRFLPDPFQRQHLPLCTAGHQHRHEKGLAALGGAGDGGHVASREAGFVLKLEQVFLVLQLCLRGDAVTVEGDDLRRDGGSLPGQSQLLGDKC